MTDAVHTTFLEPDAYPELAGIRAVWEELRDEALATRAEAFLITDGRAAPGTWSVLPLLPEEEDRHVFSEAETARLRALAPRTVALLGQHERVLAYAFSILAPGADIAQHRHHQPHVTASLCLQGGGTAILTAGGEARPFVDGEWTVFDYTQPHSVINRGELERIVLLVLLERPDGFVSAS